MNSHAIATSVIERAIECAQGPLPPPFLVEFLLEPWRRFLTSIHADHGESSEEWRLAILATDLLLWSIAPKSTEAEKAALGKSLKALIDAVKKAMQVAGWDRAAQSGFLRQMREWHLHLIETDRRPSKPGASSPDIQMRRAKEVDLSDTVHLDASDPHYREYLEMLNHAIAEKIDI